MDNWYSRVKDEIKKQQEDPVWMSEDKVAVMFSIFLFNIFNFIARNFVFLSRLWFCNIYSSVNLFFLVCKWHYYALFSWNVLLTLNASLYLQFDEQEDIEFRMPSRYSQSYDFDSTLDSPTVRSSTSTQPVDEDAVVADHGYEVKPTNCRPISSPSPHPLVQKAHLTRSLCFRLSTEMNNWSMNG